jgi:carbonic anhydrase
MIRNYFLLASFLLSLSSYANQDIKHPPNSAAADKYSGKYNLPNRDPGVYQSPINILTFETKKSNNYPFTFDLQEQITEVENLIHTVQLDFKPGSTIKIGKDIYHFKQMHFHTPSEHLIDGVTFPMELHIVAISAQYTVPHYLVIAMLFKMGKESAFINEFLDAIPYTEGKILLNGKKSIKLNELLISSDLKHHYHYKGSLTTPPYTETVNWVVLKKIFEASPEQIKTINAIEGDNARHIEPKDDRIVEEN